MARGSEKVEEPEIKPGKTGLQVGSHKAIHQPGEELGFAKELLMQDGVTAPPVPVENEAQDDWLYED